MNELSATINIALVIIGMLVSSVVTFWICWRCLKPTEPLIHEKLLMVQDEPDEPEIEMLTPAEEADRNISEMDGLL